MKRTALDLTVDLSPGQVCQRLAGQLAKPTKNRKSRSSPRGEFTGQVGHRSFCVQRKQPLFAAVGPVLRGQVEPTDSGARIVGRFETRPLESILLNGWLVLCVVFLMVGLEAAIRTGERQLLLTAWGLFMACMAVRFVRFQAAVPERGLLRAYVRNLFRDVAVDPAGAAVAHVRGSQELDVPVDVSIP